MKKRTPQRLKNLNNRLNVKNSRLFERMIHRPAMQWWFGLICMSISVASIERSKAAELSAVFGNDTLSINGVVIGDLSEERSRLALPALVQALGTPDRDQVQGHTRRITWDNQGIQLEATDQETTPFAILFEFTKPDAANQGIIPTRPYRGTLDCLRIQLNSGEPIADRVKTLAALGFSKEADSNSTETWSLRLIHWAVYLRFSADGTIGSAVIRVLPDIF
jgi:hypothetical protein